MRPNATSMWIPVGCLVGDEAQSVRGDGFKAGRSDITAIVAQLHFGTTTTTTITTATTISGGLGHSGSRGHDTWVLRDIGCVVENTGTESHTQTLGNVGSTSFRTAHTW